MSKDKDKKLSLADIQAGLNTISRELKALVDANLELAARVESLEKVAKTNGRKRRGRQPAQPVKDTKTGKVYSSQAKAGMAVAAEYGLDSDDSWVWYQVIKKDPDRFVPVDGATVESTPVAAN